MIISKMTDDELVRAVAEEVMGWSLVKHEGCDWWDTGVDDNERYWPALHFVPLLDYNQTFQVVVERMRELGWLFTVHSLANNNWEIWTFKNELYKYKYYRSIHRDFKRSILEATLVAKRGEK